LNRIGMDITVVYMFILIGLISLPAMVNILQADANSGINLFFGLIYFFMFYYLPMTIGVFLLLALIAWIGTGIAKLLRRKLRFALICKMIAYISTILGLIYTIVALTIPLSPHMLWIFCLYVLLFLSSMITIYPKRRRRPVKEG